MNPERWRQVKEIFGAALERAPGERSAFLAEACAGDELLRREVESLLIADVEETGLLGEPLGGLAAELLGGHAGALAGCAFGQYEVERELGRGGMGEVYLARDTRLDRPVALKLLPHSFTADPERVARFQREAHAVSHLNHPNIVTVYEVGEADDLRFIVTEYIEGETLRELLGRGALPPGRALDIAVQVASALAAAHAAGVVHRDVKPENVMVRPDGYVKVLDFGLAKLTEAENGDASQTQTRALKLSTRPGLVMGTVAYMSPEQARGLKVDARTDVWSLGVVLYEMLTGRTPFEGETVSHVIVNILEHEPEPLTRYAPDAPEQLQRLVGKALNKDREHRHDSMRDLLAELREARDEITFRARQELHRSGGGAESNPSLEAAQEAAAPRRSKAVLWAALTAVAALALAFGAYEYVKGRRVPAAAPSVKVERVTANGKIWKVAISRDRKLLAYTAGPPYWQQGLWVMQMGTRVQSQLIPPAEGVWVWGLTFSPDGDYIYYNTVVNDEEHLYRVPTLGGTPKRLLQDIDSAVTFSPDGKQIAFMRNTPDDSETYVLTANADGTGERTLATRRRPEYFLTQGAIRISWSPDGETIACPVGNVELVSGPSMEVVGVSVKDGTQRPLMRQRLEEVTQVEWLGDGSGLILVAADKFTSLSQVWYLSYPGGEARRVTNDFSQYPDISVAGNVAAAVQLDGQLNIWLTPVGDSARARQITDSRNNGFNGLAWTPDGRVVYGSLESGQADLWSMNADGGDRRRLTEDEGYDGLPNVSPDGRQVVFVSDRAGKLNVWRMDIDGGNVTQLTHGGGELFPHFSADARWVYYNSVRTFGISGPMLKVAAEGGEPVPVINESVGLPSLSPNNNFIAYGYVTQRTEPPSGIAIVPVDGGPAVKRLRIPLTQFKWMPDGRALAFVDEVLQNVWAQPTDGGPPRQLTDFKSDRIGWFAFSRDGKQLVLSRGTFIGDVVLITDFK